MQPDLSVCKCTRQQQQQQQSSERGSEQRQEAKAGIIQPFKARVKEFLGEGAKTLTQVGAHLRAQPGWKEALERARLTGPGGVKNAIQLLGDFTVQGARGQNTVALKRYRLRGKTRA